MADDKQKNADFIGRVVSDAKNPPETRMLTGWFGDSGEEGYRRLYTDAELNSYVDIPDDAILYTEPLRDVQPAGGVIVWITRDAALKQGGSASSRAARFLQGQVQQDFASAGAAGSLEQAGLRCITVALCGEPTGFTGQCTKQPEVGGAWPCITAIPHCFEVTGFTGKCTHAPWPNPTRYIGCTYLHCPTHDLTHIPHICNIVASGNPGCVVINPPQGGDPAQKVGAAADAEARPLPATEIPGCGYTKSWGVCETHLLGCGYTKEWGNQCPTHLPDCPTAAPGCGWSRNPICTDLPGCNWTRQPAICNQTVSQGMVPCTGPLPVDDVAAQRGATAQPASIICATSIGCDITLFCHTRFQVHCFQSLICPTQPIQCFPIPSPFCPVTQACPFGPGGGGGDPAQRFAAFGAAAPDAIIATLPAGCTVTPTAPDFGCTKSGPACPPQTVPLTQCTQTGPQCPTSCGPACQSQPPHCTSIGEACGHKLCTQAPPECTVSDPQACTPGFGCTGIICVAPNAQAFAAPRPLPLTPVGCPASDLVACSQFGGCPTLPNGDCTFFGCPSLPQQFAAAGPGGGCTQSGPQCPTHAQPQCTSFGPGCPPTPATICTQFPPCPTHARPQCTFVGPACPPTPATICTQFAPCPTHHKPCHTPGFECTMFCTQGAPGCPHTIQNAACVGPITVGGPQCPVHSGFNCPSAIGCQSIACQSIACQSIGCQPGGGGEQQAFAAAQPQAGGGIHPTIWTQIGPTCPSHLLGCTQFGAQCRTYPRGDCTFFGCPSPGIDCTVVVCTHFGPQCPHPSLQGQLCPITVGSPQCPPPPSLQGQLCPITTGGPQCPPVSGGFQCPSALCQSIACQPGGGGEQQAFPRQANVPITQQTLAILCTQTGPQCPQTQALGCTQFGPQCNSALCPPPSQQGFCPPVTSGGPQCPPVSGTFRCPSALCQSIACQSIACQPGGGGPQAFAAAFDQSTEFCPTSEGCGGVAHPQAAFGAPQTLATVCTQVGPQCPHTHGCPTPGIDCTVFCTHIGPHCPPTPATVCTQTGPQCHTQLHHICPTGGVDCTVVICTHVGPLCPPNTHPPHCPPPTPLCLTVFGPPCPPHTIQGPACPVLTTGGPQCPPASGFNCPSVAGCQSIACGQSIACVSAACQPGGGGQQEAFGARAIGGGPLQPTPATHCFVCDPQAAAAVPHTQLIVQCNPSLIDACPTRLIVQCHPSVIDACPTRLCTHQLIQCNPSVIDACPTRLCTHQVIQCHPSLIDACPTRLCTQVIQCHPSLIDACPTRQIIECNPSAVDACPTRIGCPTQNPVQCPPHSGFNCPSQIGCQSIACQSAACQPGGGGQQAFGAQAGPLPIYPTPATRCFICPPFGNQF